jgi:hypothetical protein
MVRLMRQPPGRARSTGLAFAVTFVPLLLSFFLSAASFWGDPRWRGYQWLCPALGLAAIASLILAGSLLPASLNQISFYLTLLILFVGLTLIGLRTHAGNRLSRGSPVTHHSRDRV